MLSSWTRRWTLGTSAALALGSKGECAVSTETFCDNKGTRCAVRKMYDDGRTLASKDIVRVDEETPNSSLYV